LTPVEYNLSSLLSQIIIVVWSLGKIGMWIFQILKTPKHKQYKWHLKERIKNQKQQIPYEIASCRKTQATKHNGRGILS
jgi:uncharacterized membrane protein YciS (DUF1049 family)